MRQVLNLGINKFANLVEADNFPGAKEVLKGASEKDQIMMKAILMKASVSSFVSPGMREFINSVLEIKTKKE